MLLERSTVWITLFDDGEFVGRDLQENAPMARMRCRSSRAALMTAPLPNTAVRDAKVPKP